MDLPKAFDGELRKAIHARAVWPPATPIQIGDVLVYRGDAFHKIANISSFGATATTLPHNDISLDLATSKVKQAIFQGGVQLPDTATLDLAAEASVELAFTGDSQFVLKTPTLSGASIQNMLEIGAKVAGLANWDHDNYFIVEELYTATDWSFIGTAKKGATFALKGNGSAILSFLSAGISFGLKTSGTIDLKVLGQGGAVAMNVVRVRKDGSSRYDT